MGVVRAPQTVIDPALKSIVIGEVYAKSFSGPKVIAVNSIVDNLIPPHLTPFLGSLKIEIRPVALEEDALGIFENLIDR